jgi:4-amino-4-deoxy-L-arabinose transferase-like glycosyltransferase
MNLEKLGGRKVFLILSLALVIRLYVSWRPLFYVDNLFIPDDTYLALKIAKNIASGAGITFDGIHPTNGFQPLYVFLISPIYLIFKEDLITPVHICLSLLAIFNVLTGLLIYKILKKLTDARKGILALILWSFSPQIISNGINGLETSLSLFLVVLSVFYYLTRIQESENLTYHGFFVLGTLLGLSIFARIDSIFLLLAISVDLFLRSKQKLKWLSIKSFLGKLGLIYVFAFFILLPWWIFQLVYFKTLVPTSGEAVRFQALVYADHGLTLDFFKDKFVWSLTQWTNSPFPFYHFSHFPSLSELLIFIFILGGLFVLLVRKQKITKNIAPLNFLWIFCFGLLLFYCFYVPAHWFFKRYYYPVIFVLTLYWGVLFDLIIDFITQRFKVQRFLLIFVFLIFCGVLFYPNLKNFLFSRPDSPLRCDSESCSGYYKVALWIKDHVEKGKKIGSYQSGALGYFLEDNTVVNLDGVVNPDAFRALKNKNAFGYVKSENITFLTDWPLNLRHFLIRCNSGRITEQDLVPIGAAPSQKELGYYLFKVQK